MSALLLTHCGGCGGATLDAVLSLGSSPPTCLMQPVDQPVLVEEHYPLDLVRCSDCQLVQLSVVVDPEVVFPPDTYPYSSGNSRALHENFADLAKEASLWVGGLTPDDLVVDVGANDGTLLGKFAGCQTVGVEPTIQARKIVGAAFQEPFTQELAEEIVERYGEAKIVTACNVLAHVEDVGEVMAGIATLLAPGGLFVAENHDLASVVDGWQWDTVYHEHLRFYDPTSFERMINRYDLGTRAWHTIATHGGSFRTFAGHGAIMDPPPEREYDFERLRDFAARARHDLRSDIAEKGPVWGIGATARATTIINYCGLSSEDVTAVGEVEGSDKIGHFIPGTRIPVVDEALILTIAPRLLLLSWHMADRLVPKLRAGGYAGQILVPLPRLHPV